MKLGGIYAAALQFGVPSRTVRHFIAGTVDVPDNVLLLAIDIVLDEDVTPHGVIAASHASATISK